MNFVSLAVEMAAKFAIGSTIVASMISVLTALYATRSKIRAKWMLREQARDDGDLAKLLDDIAAGRLTGEGRRYADDVIEAKLKALSASDRRFVLSGLHQPKADAVMRFKRELATRS